MGTPESEPRWSYFRIHILKSSCSLLLLGWMSLSDLYLSPRIITPLSFFFSFLQGHSRSVKCFLSKSSREVHLVLGILLAAEGMGNFIFPHHPKVKSLSHVQLFATWWIVAYQAPLSRRFSMQEYQSGLPLPSPGDLPDPGIEPRSPALGGCFALWATREAQPPSRFFNKEEKRMMRGWDRNDCILSLPR